MKQNSIESKFLEIKDKSELMVDLSYSSLIYNRTNIANEVYELEELIDGIYEEIQQDILKEVKNGSLSVGHALALMKLAKAGEEIADAALEIADVQLRDVDLHPIVKMSIRESDEVLNSVKVEKVMLIEIF